MWSHRAHASAAWYDAPLGMWCGVRCDSFVLLDPSLSSLSGFHAHASCKLKNNKILFAPDRRAIFEASLCNTVKVTFPRFLLGNRSLSIVLHESSKSFSYSCPRDRTQPKRSNNPFASFSLQELQPCFPSLSTPILSLQVVESSSIIMHGKCNLGMHGGVAETM